MKKEKHTGFIFLLLLIVILGQISIGYIGYLKSKESKPTPICNPIKTPCEKFEDVMRNICIYYKNDVCRVAQMTYLKCIKDNGEKIDKNTKTKR